MEELPSPTVTTAWLVAHVDSDDLRLLDTRWTLGEGAAQDAYRQGHIPGAVFVDLDQDLAGPPGRGGRHPLPDPREFSQTMREAGISADSPVVVYDQVTGAAARAWWLLRAGGHARVAVLDGGLDAYLAAGGELTQEVPQPRPGDFVTSAFARSIPADAIAKHQRAGHLVLDARARERFRGDPNPLDPRAGHVPGAHSLPWTELYQRGHILGPKAVRRRVAEAGHDHQPIVAYCGSGVSACALLLALEAAGLDELLLYPGSWSEWAGDPARHVELSP